MNNQIPSSDQFDVKALASECLDSHSGAEMSFQVEVIPARITQRVLVGFFDEATQKGISVALYPATGEVCDLMNGGEVIGYLSKAPLIPGDPVSCDLKISRFGRNLVCSLRIQGELFLYPAYVAAERDTILTAVVGQENDGSNAMIGWTNADVVSHLEAISEAA